jgi:hypothetical protein
MRPRDCSYLVGKKRCIGAVGGEIADNAAGAQPLRANGVNITAGYAAGRDHDPIRAKGFQEHFLSVCRSKPSTIRSQSAKSVRQLV